MKEKDAPKGSKVFRRWLLSMLRLPAHVAVSWIFLLLILIVLLYSFFFYPGDIHPVDCFYKAHTGKDCPACGFSRAFSSFMHFHFSEGKNLNPGAWPAFLFFALQFFIRSAVISRYYITKKTLSAAYVKTDIVISISTFLLAFLPLLINS